MLFLRKGESPQTLFSRVKVEHYDELVCMCVNSFSSVMSVRYDIRIATCRPVLQGQLSMALRSQLGEETELHVAILCARPRPTRVAPKLAQIRVDLQAHIARTSGQLAASLGGEAAYTERFASIGFEEAVNNLFTELRIDTEGRITVAKEELCG